MQAMGKGPEERLGDRGQEAGQRQGQRRRRQGKEAGKQRIGLRQFFHWPVIGENRKPHPCKSHAINHSDPIMLSHHSSACMFSMVGLYLDRPSQTD